MGVILLGLILGGAGYMLFGGNSSRPDNKVPESAAQVAEVVGEKDGNHSDRNVPKGRKVQETAGRNEKKPLEEVRQNDGKVRDPIGQARDSVGQVGQVGQKDKKVPDVGGKKDKKAAEKVDAGVDQEQKNQHLALKVSDSIVLPTRGLAPVAPAGKRQKEAKADAKAEVAAADSDSEPVEPAAILPSLPKDLAPKIRPQDVELTFYDALASRKVVLPHDSREQVVFPPGRVAGKPASPGGRVAAAPSPAKNMQDLSKAIQTAVQEKGSSAVNPAAGDTGPYMVQLAVFSSYERAAQMVSQLQRKGRVAHMVHSEGASGPVYRVRTGPYPSFSDAKTAMDALPTDGQSPMIIKPPPR